jgi:hypothetical protein
VKRGAHRLEPEAARGDRTDLPRAPEPRSDEGIVTFGAPIELDDLRATRVMRRASQEATDRLMGRIAELEASL